MYGGCVLSDHGLLFEESKLSGDSEAITKCSDKSTVPEKLVAEYA